MRRACVALWVVLTSAIVSGVAFSGDQTWWTFSLSRLGSSSSRSAFVFNVGTVLAALVLVELARRAWGGLGGRVRAGVMTGIQRQGVVAVTLAVGLLLALVGLVPYDRGPAAFAVHNAAGWGEAWLLGACMFLLPWMLPNLDRRFYAISWMCLGGILGSYALYYHGVLTIGLTEIGALTSIALWMNLFFGEMESPQQRRVPGGSAQPDCRA